MNCRRVHALIILAGSGSLPKWRLEAGFNTVLWLPLASRWRPRPSAARALNGIALGYELVDWRGRPSWYHRQYHNQGALQIVSVTHIIEVCSQQAAARAKPNPDPSENEIFAANCGLMLI
jgi:hypothetical protein